MTTDALDGAPWPLASTPPAHTAVDARLARELPFKVADAVSNLWSISMLAGMQFNDQGQLDIDDLVGLAILAAEPALQREHCLRGPSDDGATGDAGALAACRAFILSELTLALGDGDPVDLAATEPVHLTLVFRGAIDVPLQRFGFHVGRAGHALQDSFTHAFRSPDLVTVRTVLNWVDWVKASSFDEPTDGHQHLAALDKCSGDDSALARREAALTATRQLLAALASDDGGRAGRLARASSVVDAWLGLAPGCTAENAWCDARERDMTNPTACAFTPGTGAPTGPAGWLAGAAGLALALRSRRRRRRSLGPIALALALATASSFAHAEEVKGTVVKKATPEEQARLDRKVWGVVAKGGIAVDHTAFDFGVGLRRDLGPQFTVGFDVEQNPWVAANGGKVVAGSLNAYGVGIWRLDVRDYLELRATLGLGASFLMFETVAAPQGSVGPYLAISPLGVAFRMGSRWRLIVDPAEIAMPVPTVRGIPLVYRQHRFSVGLQANF